MPEWLPTNDGRPLKTSDALLDYISDLLAERDQLREELKLAMECALVR